VKILIDSLQLLKKQLAQYGLLASSFGGFNMFLQEVKYLVVYFDANYSISRAPSFFALNGLNSCIL